MDALQIGMCTELIPTLNLSDVIEGKTKQVKAIQRTNYQPKSYKKY
jgi:hypothetical protein